MVIAEGRNRQREKLQVFTYNRRPDTAAHYPDSGVERFSQKPRNYPA